MTCIVGIANGTTVWMGGDSAATDTQSGDSGVVADPKVFQIGKMLLGYTGSFRMGQLLQYKLTLPRRRAGQSDSQYLTTTFTDRVRSIFDDAEVSGHEDRPEFLLGYRGRLYELGADFYVLNYESQETAVGSGGAFALGSLHTTRLLKAGMPPMERIRLALLASAANSAFVKPPFHIIHS